MKFLQHASSNRCPVTVSLSTKDYVEIDSSHQIYFIIYLSLETIIILKIKFLGEGKHEFMDPVLTCVLEHVSSF